METSHLRGVRRRVFTLIVLKSPPMLPFLTESVVPSYESSRRERDFRRSSRSVGSSSSGRGFAASRPRRPTDTCGKPHILPIQPSASRLVFRLFPLSFLVPSFPLFRRSNRRIRLLRNESTPFARARFVSFVSFASTSCYVVKRKINIRDIFYLVER